MEKIKYQNKLDGKYTKNALDSLTMSPRPIKEHQIAIYFIILSLFSFFKKHRLNFLAISETELGLPNSPAPDILVITKKKNENVTFIEVTNSSNQSIAIEKSTNALIEYHLQECFVYNYQTQNWYKITPENVLNDETKSETLNFDLKNIKFQ